MFAAFEHAAEQYEKAAALYQEMEARGEKLEAGKAVSARNAEAIVGLALSLSKQKGGTLVERKHRLVKATRSFSKAIETAGVEQAGQIGVHTGAEVRRLLGEAIIDAVALLGDGEGGAQALAQEGEGGGYSLTDAQEQFRVAENLDRAAGNDADGRRSSAAVAVRRKLVEAMLQSGAEEQLSRAEDLLLEDLEDDDLDGRALDETSRAALPTMLDPRALFGLGRIRCIRLMGSGYDATAAIASNETCSTDATESVMRLLPQPIARVLQFSQHALSQSGAASASGGRGREMARQEERGGGRSVFSMLLAGMQQQMWDATCVHGSKHDKNGDGGFSCEEQTVLAMLSPQSLRDFLGVHYESKILHLRGPSQQALAKSLFSLEQLEPHLRWLARSIQGDGNSVVSGTALSWPEDLQHLVKVSIVVAVRTHRCAHLHLVTLNAHTSPYHAKCMFWPIGWVHRAH
jgi:hypothetical protein